MLIKVQYDAQNRMFKLVDSQHRTIIEGDALYDLAIPMMFEDDEHLLSSLPIVSATLKDGRADRDRQGLSVL